MVVVGGEGEWRAGRREETGSVFLGRRNFNRDKRPAAPLLVAQSGCRRRRPPPFLGRVTVTVGQGESKSTI